jgi:glycosyltransferase involved in cell wall biosynthesis
MHPLVSIILPVKNGLPHLQTAIEAISRQTYSRYELVVQDGGSTDGTLDYLSSLQMPNLLLASEPDSGIGQAYNRGLMRASGDLICLSAADELLEDDAIESAVWWFARHADAVHVNGSVRMINAEGKEEQVTHAQHFDLLGHLRCEVVLWFAGLLDRRKIGTDFYYDESLRTCPDYDFWIRLGTRFEPHNFVAVRQIFHSARTDRVSMSFRAESFDQFCRDKVFVLNRFLDAQTPGPIVDALRRSATAGIYVWAAENVFALEGASPAFIRWCEKTAAVDPWSARLQKLSVSTSAFTIDEEIGHLTVTAQQFNQPPHATKHILNHLALDRAYSLPGWKGAAVDLAKTTGSFVVRTGPEAWAYAAVIPWESLPELNADLWYWACLDIEVLAGRVGIAAFVGDDLIDEQTAAASHGRKTVFVRITDPQITGIMIRNGGLPVESRIRVHAAWLECAPRVTR